MMMITDQWPFVHLDERRLRRRWESANSCARLYILISQWLCKRPWRDVCTGHQHQPPSHATVHTAAVLTRGVNKWLVYINMHTHICTHTHTHAHTHTHTHMGAWSTPWQMIKILQGKADGFNNKWYHWSSQSSDIEGNWRKEQLTLYTHTHTHTYYLCHFKLMTQICKRY